MAPTVTAIYTALMALLVLGLAYEVTRRRRRLRIGFGSGGDGTMEAAVRAHANAVEYIPLALLLVLVAELQGAPAWLLHGLGATLLVARLAHAEGLLVHGGGISRGRIVGTALTWLVISAGAVAVLTLAVL